MCRNFCGPQKNVKFVAIRCDVIFQALNSPKLGFRPPDPAGGITTLPQDQTSLSAEGVIPFPTRLLPRLDLGAYMAPR